MPRASLRASARIEVVAFATLLLAACSDQPREYQWGVDPTSLPQVVTETDFPELRQGSADAIWLLAGKDLSDKDLRQLSLPFLSAMTFDHNTLWPDAAMLPEGFAPSEWTEVAKDPGLSVRDLHRQGITGKGVVVAVIDKPIRPDHIEFGERIRYHEVFEGASRGFRPHFHGMACASILVGETVGVAPEATLHYFATPDIGENFHYYSLALDRVIEVNTSLPEDERIRLVSISDGLGRDNPFADEWAAALERAREANIDIVYSSGDRLNGFLWGGCPPDADRGDASCYKLALYFKGRDISSERVLIPGDYRTTASNIGPDTYVYWGNGGWSWAIPYAAGLAALAWQINPEMTIDQIEEALRETAAPSGDGRSVIQPLAFIDQVRAGTN
jgi:subtilisin family serine protease